MKDKEIILCIDCVPIFANLNEEDKQEILKFSKHKQYKKGSFIYVTGDKINSLNIIHRGSVKIIRYTLDGKEQVIRVLKEGDFFGENAFFKEISATSYVEVLEDSVICELEGNAFLEAISNKPVIATNMLLELSKRMRNLEDLLVFSNYKKAEEKMAKYFLDNLIGDRVIFNTTKKNISAHLGITPETFSRRLNMFIEEGNIKKISNREIKILNISYFEELIVI
ncbi:MAG: Crp/Fnr family transcriptional regulator [Erysipelotrichaceae bacterium]|nr:Crp/Fnr family transcriptional regulator [Erysipelotrichaceae bacterium]